MKKSKSETADTRKRIVETAAKLFLDRGISETSNADVMVAAGLTQGGFYRHFDSKDQLIAEANRMANQKMFEYYEAAIAGKSPIAALETLIHLYLHQTQGEDAISRLCPLSNLGSELRRLDESIREVAMGGFERLTGAIAMLAGQLGISDPKRLADAIVSTLVGAVTLSRLSVDPVMTENLLKNTEFTIHSQIKSQMAQNKK